ncbi:MAG: MjaI family restriction endonuclease, partial [Bacteroidia bacterium]
MDSLLLCYYTYQILNQRMNELQINHPRRLGFSLVELSRKTKPNCLNEWNNYVIEELGKNNWTFEKLATILESSCEIINFMDCKKYIEDLFIFKT